ncbi:MAG: type I-E CRISPR-associated endonuclease Cas1e [Candidatus Methanomethylophilaceae archaeon]|nr:type I-E CRISPR-associated endonuclease Cas1e [Candidatus Methanomethylophilaceae archaeon]
MAKDYRDLPKIRDSLSYLYMEHCRIEQDGMAIASYDLAGRTRIPCAALSLLILGPGTSITHEAIKNVALNGCSIVWGGEECVRYYAQGYGETRKSYRLINQAMRFADSELRLDTAKRMYSYRFPEDVDTQIMTIDELKGYEGIRVRAAYSRMSKEYGVPWKGRCYKRDDWNVADPINKALSAANSCLYGICHAAIVSIGCSPGLGFIHSGKQLSFVYDVADLYKTELAMPVAFSSVSSGEGPIDKIVRSKLRDEFRKQRILSKIVEDIDYILKYADNDDGPAFDTDSALPASLWDGK